jgi:hypothetical protein
MIREPPLLISNETYVLIAEAAQRLNMDPARWEDVDPSRRSLRAGPACETP